ncbi:NADPH:quinone oxidoreductase family protein [Pseudaestuariivita sp.]|uniref:NADPH:quinone oxidoreductase family protein n=1 Tax=Pseudaestuariivita sp. TaxID=2211669 RepID=UPI0040598448
MKAITISGDARDLTLTEMAAPEPGAGEIQLSIRACGLNFADLLMIKGTYQDTPPLPFVLGMEVAGEITALGAGVEGLKVGDRVAVFGGQGGLAEVGCFPADRAVPLPEGMSMVDAAAFQIAYGTSHVALAHRAKLQAGETLCVLGAAGGVGLTAVELGKLMGATVIAVARGADKLEAAKAAGADHLLDATSCDLRAELKALGGIDVLYDPVGGDQWKDAFRAAKPEARLLPIGFASGEVPQVPTNHLLVKNISVLGVYWGGYMAFRPTVITDSLRELLGWYAKGDLKPHVSHVLPLERTEEGLELMRNRASTGKVVIEIG